MSESESVHFPASVPVNRDSMQAAAAAARAAADAHRDWPWHWQARAADSEAASASEAAAQFHWQPEWYQASTTVGSGWHSTQARKPFNLKFEP